MLGGVSPVALTFIPGKRTGCYYLPSFLSSLPSCPGLEVEAGARHLFLNLKPAVLPLSSHLLLFLSPTPSVFISPIAIPLSLLIFFFFFSLSLPPGGGEFA